MPGFIADVNIHAGLSNADGSKPVAPARMNTVGNQRPR